MTRINRISGSRPPAPISRQPEQEPAYLKEQIRQRSELEDQNEESKRRKQPTPEEQAQRKAERLMDGAVRTAAVKGSDPTAVPVISISDLFHRAKSAGLHQDEIARIQIHLKKLNGQERTYELRFLQESILPARNVNQCLRAYAELAALALEHPERIDPLVIRSLAISVTERSSGKHKIPGSICSRQEALDAAIVFTMMPQTDHERMLNLLMHAGERLGEKSRDADPDTERALILKALCLRSRLFTEPDPAARIRQIAQVPMKPMIEVEHFAMRIRGIASQDLLDYAKTTLPLHPVRTISTHTESSALSPQQYLRDGFYTPSGAYRDELLGVLAIQTAEQLSTDGLESTLLRQIVHQLTHVATEYENRFKDSLGYKLDPAALTVVGMVMEAEEVSQSPALWELMDAASRWVRDLKGLAGLILHLDAISDLL
jgi:hypothetical protein